jgi:hypothetical protein
LLRLPARPQPLLLRPLEGEPALLLHLLLADLVGPDRRHPLLLRLAQGELPLPLDLLLAGLVYANPGEPALLRLALGELALLDGALLLDLTLALGGLPLGDDLPLSILPGGLALTLGGELRLAARLGLGLTPKLLGALGAEIGLGPRPCRSGRLALARLRLLLGGGPGLGALLKRLATGRVGLAMLRLASRYRLALLRLTSGQVLALLLLTGRERLTLLALTPGNGLALLLLLANRGLPGNVRLLALLFPLLLRLRPRFGAVAPLRGGISGLRHHRRHHCGRHQQGDHVLPHRVDSFIPSSPLNMAAGSHKARDPVLNPLFTKEKYPEAGSERRPERHAPAVQRGYQPLA